MPADIPRIVVIAAVIEKENAFLVTRRIMGVHLEGYWEFPGGKCDEGESHAACLAREIAEELGAGSRIGAEIFSVAHAYPERIVELHFFECDLLDDPRPLLGQEMRWVGRGDLATLEFPPADAELLALLGRHER
jgi:8-oxo-dGTP diphosphatase